MIKRMNKRGQELTIGTLILIVLGVIILVLLVIGFSVGWENIFKKFNIFGGGTDIESVVQSCKIALSSNAKYTFCEQFNKISVDGKVEYVNCQDSRIAGSLDGSIECGEKLAENYCLDTLRLKANDKFNVNGGCCSANEGGVKSFINSKCDQ